MTLETNEIHVWILPELKTNSPQVLNILSNYLNVTVSSLKVLRNHRGKPFLDTPYSNLQFNLSNTKDLSALAITWDTPIGIDIEKINPSKKTNDLAKRFFHPSEANEVLTNKNPIGKFYEVWTKKEATTKTVGQSIWNILGEETKKRDDEMFCKSFTVKEDYITSICIKLLHKAPTQKKIKFFP